MSKLAAQTLNDQKSSITAKKLAGSVLSQSNGKHQTGAQIEDLASSVLISKKYNLNTKSLAGSALSQSNKKR